METLHHIVFFSKEINFKNKRENANQNLDCIELNKICEMGKMQTVLVCYTCLIINSIYIISPNKKEDIYQDSVPSHNAMNIHEELYFNFSK